MDALFHRNACRRGQVLSVLLLPILSTVAMADAVLDWNEHAVATVLAARPLPPDGARAMAMIHVSMFDAINALERRYRFYCAELPPVAQVSAEAAAAAAAHVVLLHLFPEQRRTIEQVWSESLNRLSHEQGLHGGIALGEQAARNCIARRATDGVGAPNLYRPVTTPGVYVPTSLPVSYDWRAVQPWFLDSPLQFRPDPPPALTSVLWAQDYNEIVAVGGRDSRARAPEQTETARFWTMAGVASWNPIIRACAVAGSLSLLENARIFALVNMVTTDAYIATFEAKYTFHFWRPITAIRNGDIDGNDDTASDAGWSPLVETPLHPEYPCAHCVIAGAVAQVLEEEFGTGNVCQISMSSSTAPGVTHRWERIADYATEVNNGRVWGGVHYRHSTEVGERMGRSIGRKGIESVLQGQR